MLAGLVAITAPSGFVNTVGAAIIGFAAGMLVCLSVEFVERVLKVDDPVGAISVHGTCGLWGVMSVGLFADGTSNYGGSWNGVDGSVRGLFYGDPSQLVAQTHRMRDAGRDRVHHLLSLNWLIDGLVGQRVGAASELEGLDLPEMGALGYPEFQLVTSGLGRSVEVARTRRRIRIMDRANRLWVMMLVVFALWQTCQTRQERVRQVGCSDKRPMVMQSAISQDGDWWQTREARRRSSATPSTCSRRGIDALEHDRFEEAAGLLRQAVELAPRIADGISGAGDRTRPPAANS